jgi:hypothetical protein
MNLSELIAPVMAETKPRAMCDVCKQWFDYREIEVIEDYKKCLHYVCQKDAYDRDAMMQLFSMDEEDNCSRCGEKGITSLVGDETFTMCEVCRDDMGVTK